MKRSVLVGALLVTILGALGAGWAVARPGGEEGAAAFASREPSHRSAGSTSLGVGQPLLRIGAGRLRSSRDHTAPNTTITKAPSASTRATNVGFSFNSSEARSSFACKLDGAGWTRCNSPKSYAALAVGTHQFSVRATDAAGNTDATPAVDSWSVTVEAPSIAPAPESPPDTTAPETTIASGPEARTTATSASFAFASSEPGSTFSCQLDGGSWSPCASPTSYAALALGTHQFSVRATDAAGNTDGTPATQSWTVEAPPPPPDTTAPETQITAGPGSSTTETTADFSFSASEPGSTFVCQLDGGSWAGCTSPSSYAGLAVGDHTFSVRATDAAGNVDATPAISAWTVQALPPPPDATAPETSITDQPASPTTATSASFTFNSSEPGSTFACQLDGDSWTSCSAPVAYANLALGSHTFSVRATDAAGNADATPATQSWTVEAPPPPPDTTAPETQITAGPGSSTTETTADFSFSASEPGSTFTCQFDGGSWSPCTSPTAYAALALGSHQFSVRATDAAGNTDSTPATRSWTVEAPPPPPDTTEPETTIASGPEASTTATSASFAFTASEPGSTFACKLDGTSWAPCSSPTAYGSLALGSHQFSVRATDAAGNTDATPATRSWTVNAPEPPPVESSSCDQTVSSTSAAQSALSSAAVGSVVCLADGSYGSLSLSMKRPAPGVTLRAQNPGQASVGGVTVSGGGVTVERLVTGSLNVSASANGFAFRHNSATGGVYVIGTTSSYAKNIEVSGNLIKPSSGSGEKDTFMLQRFEGLRIENNQIWIADEDGNHNDGLQTVWGGRGLIFRGNWMRGGAGSQGFFIKDGEVTNVTFEDNLIAGRPSKAPYAGAPLQVFDTVPNAADPFYTGYGLLIRHNTIWSNPNTSYARECQNKAILVEFNVMDGWGAPDGTSCVLSQLTQDYNVITGGTIGKRGAHDTSTAPNFVDSANQDWQLTSGSAGNFSTGRAGITWRPVDQTYGP